MIAPRHALTIAKNLLELGKLAEAAEVLAPIVAHADAPPAALWLAGRIAGLNSEPWVAIPLLERALALVPTAAPIYEDMAYAWGAFGQPRHALDILYDGMNRIGPNPRLLASAASYALDILDREQARDLLGVDPAARAVFPGVEALLALHDGDWPAAIAAFAEVFELPPPVPTPAPKRDPAYYAPPCRNVGAPLPKPTIATSLSPRGGAAQREALETWREFAAEVISVNSPDEIAALATAYPFVRFVATDRHGGDLVGKPLVFVDDVLDALSASGATFCGIINGDILLLDGARLATDLATAGADALTIFHRLDIDAPTSAEGQPYVTGFDGFFFSAERIPLFCGSRLMLGAPWWDYLLPTLAILRDVPVAIPESAAIGHVRHTIQWSTVSYIRTAQIWLEQVRDAAHDDPGTIASAFMTPFIDQYLRANPWCAAPLADDPEVLSRYKLSLNPLVTTIIHLIRTQARRIGAAE